jgi:hypothetical protein
MVATQKPKVTCNQSGMPVTYAGNPNEGPHVVTTLAGTKRKWRRQNSRRGESLRADTAIEGGPCRRARLAAPPIIVLPPQLPQSHVDSGTIVDAAERTCRAKAAAEAQRHADEAALLRSLNTVVISLERRPDRMEGCRSRFASLCPELQFRRMPAVDGRATVIGANLVTASWDTTENVVYQRLRSERKG